MESLSKHITDTINNRVTPFIKKLSPASAAVSNANAMTPVNASTSSYSGVAMVLVILVLLALLGINLFYFIAEGTGELASDLRYVFMPVFRLFGYSGGAGTASSSAGNSNSNANANTSNTSDQPASGSDTNLEQPLGTAGASNQSSLSQQQAQQQALEDWQQSTLQRALNDAASSAPNVMPTESGGSAGWCYVGEDKGGMRTCASVGVNDYCSSGNVFPTQAECINPKLRMQ